MRRGEWTIANRILVIRDDGVHVVCPTCPTSVRVPFLAVSEGLPTVRRPPAADVRRLVVRVPRA